MRLFKLMILWFLKFAVLFIAGLGGAAWTFDLIEHYQNLGSNEMVLLVFTTMCAFLVGLFWLYVKGDDRLWKEIEKEANRLLMEKHREK